ncbi:MAG: 6-carboxytetrahydropterin synthase [Bryobacteraceae bacterium]|jgi:6-pyruvoyltetrahydropterin/6-carboxytetrahydropterin synthase
MFRVTRRYRFAASHRLHALQLSAEENRRLYGKCNHPFGHGHDYVLDVSVRGPLDALTGRAADTAALDELVARRVIRDFDHRDLNSEVEAFARAVPTSENLAGEICRRLKESWSGSFPGEWPKLEGVRLAETSKNVFEMRADEAE